MTVMESILKDLETLPASKLVEVAHYVSRFNPKRRGERVAALRDTAGCMAGEEGEAFEKAVEEEADRCLKMARYVQRMKNNSKA